MPERVQRRRIKGEKGMPDGAIYVGRPSRWGNPWRVGWIGNHVDSDGGPSWGAYGPGVFAKTGDQASAQELAVALYRSWLCTRTLRVHKPERDRILTELPNLRGHDLACWCPPEFACHADVLLELANQEVASGAHDR